MSVVFPAPPLGPRLIDDRTQKLIKSHSEIGLPLDLFQAIFYSALGFAGIDRLIDLVQTHNINAVVGYSAVVTLSVLSVWLTLRYVHLLGTMVMLLFARVSSEEEVNNSLLSGIVVGLLFVIAVAFNFAFSISAKCALLNECPNHVSAEGLKK